MSTLRKLSENNAEEDQLKTSEREAIIEATRHEISWWGRPGLGYPTPQDQERAVKNGELVKVMGPNKYFAMPSDIRADEHLQYLRPSALNFLMEVMQELNERINFSQRGMRFAITSLYRSKSDQEENVNGENWYRSVPVRQGSHTAGAAFDISLRSHYIFNKDSGGLRTANTWDSNKIADFDPEAIEALGALLSEKASQGLCNLVVENRVDTTEGNDYTPTCLHVCISPAYEERYIREDANA